MGLTNVYATWKYKAKGNESQVFNSTYSYLDIPGHFFGQYRFPQCYLQVGAKALLHEIKMVFNAENVNFQLMQLC